MQLVRSLVLILAVYFACCATFATADDATAARVADLETSNPSIHLPNSKSVHRLLRDSNTAPSTDDPTAEERGSLLTKLKGLFKKLPGASKKLPKTSSSLKATAQKEKEILKQAEATLTKPAADALKAAQKDNPGALARADSLVKGDPSLVAAIEKSPAGNRIAEAVVKNPREKGWGEIIGALIFVTGLSGTAIYFATQHSQK